MRRLHALLLAVLVVSLSACVPTAEWLRDRLDTGGGATLDYLTEGQGVTFQPGPAAAYDVRVSLRSETGVTLLEGAPTECAVEETGRFADCEFAVVEVGQVIVIPASGDGLLGSAVYAREPGSLAWEWAYTPIQ